ncbi:MAG: hypothetical protein GWO24_07875, partial [Akkermansiaceae bacterium]|nr:hypothetical protein [Akkermansiaceae bacterium]
MPTNTPTKLLAACLLLAFSPLTFGQSNLNFLWEDRREWQMLGPNSTFYLGGSTDVFFSDGFIVLSGCFHPTFQIWGPSLGCPLGTTGFIAQGDIDFDGINDVGSFWSVAAVQRAERIEPFRPDQFLILSAPPSGIADALRESGGDITEVFDVIDQSVVVWYNVLAPPIDDFEITIY